MARKKEPAEIKIEKNIPIPARRGGRGTKYPWAEMKVGDSFVSNRAAVSAATSWQRKHSPFKFASRREESGFRIWRIK